MTFLDRCFRRKWGWPIGILLLALVLRLTWIQDAGFTHDVSFFVRWMRLAARCVSPIVCVDDAVEIKALGR